ncbi:MAG: hypothetical protein U0736_24265 [Gemmataceae bacterium]
MRYAIEWLPQAEDDLARIWMSRPGDSQAINGAVNRIERELRDNAHRKGAPVDNYRCYVDLPLKVLYVAIPDDNRVSIIECRWVEC